MAAGLTAGATRRRRLSEETRHVLVGALVVGILALLFVLSAGRGGAIEGYTVTARFPSAEGIYVGSAVRLAGVRIGRVSGMRYDSATQRTVLTLEIEAGIELPLDSIAVVTSQGILGGRFIRLEPGGSLDLLADGDTIEFTQGSIQFEELLARVITAVERKRQQKHNGEPQGGGQ